MLLWWRACQPVCCYGDGHVSLLVAMVTGMSACLLLWWQECKPVCCLKRYILERHWRTVVAVCVIFYYLLSSLFLETKYVKCSKTFIPRWKLFVCTILQVGGSGDTLRPLILVWNRCCCELFFCKLWIVCVFIDFLSPNKTGTQTDWYKFVKAYALCNTRFTIF